MITLLEVLNYRCLRYVRQELNSFHVLIGAECEREEHFFWMQFDSLAVFCRMVWSVRYTSGHLILKT